VEQVGLTWQLLPRKYSLTRRPQQSGWGLNLYYRISEQGGTEDNLLLDLARALLSERVLSTALESGDDSKAGGSSFSNEEVEVTLEEAFRRARQVELEADCFLLDNVRLEAEEIAAASDELFAALMSL
jgi:hypothetical protein